MNNTVQPWGVWPTLGLTGVLILTIGAIETLLATLYIVLTSDMAFDPAAPQAYQQHLLNAFLQLENNGNFFSLIVTIRLVIGVALVALFCKLRKTLPLRTYLALTPFRRIELLIYALILIAVMLALEGLYYLLGRETIPEFMLRLYRNSDNLPLLWFTVVVSAPLLEEIVFRGFLFTGLAGSRLGALGAVTVTALLWAAVHFQYAWPEMLGIFVLGIVLGMARWQSGSLWLPIILHALNNLAATVQLASVIKP